MDIHNEDFTALPNAIEALHTLTTKGKVVIFTIGERVDQIRKLTKLGITNMNIFGIECSVIKNAATFASLKQKYPAAKRYMFGDSLIRDILPALEVGGINVYHISSQQGDGSFPTYTTLYDAVNSLE
jgi:FMN phosphatase YigB (HAD superfamily)